MNKFIVGDRVILVNLRIYNSKDHYDPNAAYNVIGSEGEILEVGNDTMPYYVEWDNGTAAYYAEHNLVPECEDYNHGRCVDE